MAGTRELNAIPTVKTHILQLQMAGSNASNINKGLVEAIAAEYDLGSIALKLCKTIAGFNKTVKPYQESGRLKQDSEVVAALAKLNATLTGNYPAVLAFKKEVADVMKMLWDDKVQSSKKQADISSLQQSGEKLLDKSVLEPFIVGAICVVLGAILGAIAGLFLGGIAAVPCAMFGAYLGASLGIILGGGTALAININTQLPVPKWFPTLFSVAPAQTYNDEDPTAILKNLTGKAKNRVLLGVNNAS